LVTPEELSRRHLPTVLAAALAAGREILAVYASDFAVAVKADDSPLTAADTRAHGVIRDALAPIGLPLLSEEGRETAYAERRRWDRLWIVDPLDGTKEFVSRNGEFTVNIALVADQRPVMGVIYEPVADRLYLGLGAEGAWRIEAAGRVLAGGREAGHWRQTASRLPLARAADRPFTVVGSRSHANAVLTDFVAMLRRQHDPLEFVAAGSALKFCRLAEGGADIYPRPAPTMEWDTAAGQGILEAVGGRVMIWESDQPLTYNRPNLVNPGFVAFAPGVRIS
jgi:3'(2'), 5'-bisphosphate nucleotidase